MRASVGQKQLPALFKLTGGQTTTEHEIPAYRQAGAQTLPPTLNFRLNPPRGSKSFGLVSSGSTGG